MTISKINKKYCRGNRAQLMLSRGNSQVVFNEDGILYLKMPMNDNELIIHKYLTDPERNYFPYHDVPVSERQHNHLFECDKIYTEITSLGEESRLNFKLFKHLDNGDVLVEKLGLGNFDKIEREIPATKEMVEKYLKRQPDEQAKYIFEMWDAVNFGNGFKYASFEESDEVFNIFKIPLNNESILKAFNKKNEPIEFYLPIYDDNEKAQKRQEEIRKRREERAWEKHSIDEVSEFSLTEGGFLATSEPYMIILKDGETFVKKFDIRFIRENEFLIKEKIYHITKEKFKIEHGINHRMISYTGDPFYIKTSFPPIENKEVPPIKITSLEELLALPSSEKYQIVKKMMNQFGFFRLTKEKVLKLVKIASIYLLIYFRKIII